ncbi:MAG TPA: uridine kinase [Microlunatus sp.]
MSGIDPVTAVVTALAGRTGTRWVGIDGFGASGKTTLASRVAAALPGAVVIHNDDFARPELPGWDRDRFVRQVVEPLRSGRPGRYQRWDFDADIGAEWHTVPSGVPVIVEGVSATDVRLSVPWDFTIWIEAPTPVRRSRIADRDGPDLQHRWQTDWIPMEEAYAADQRPWERVDLVHVPEAVL